MSIRHHILNSDPDAWGGLGWETAPNPNCARPGCEQLSRYDGGADEEYCSTRCAVLHLGRKP
jgi:hypothetical protein